MWSNKYLGIPYKTHGRDESGIDCWGLVRLVYKAEYNIDLPSFSESYIENDRARSEELIAQYREGWEELDHPEEGCIVVLRVMGHLSHVGICINNRQFLHAQEGSGSSVQDFDSVKWSKRVAGFFKYKESAGIVLNAIPHPLKTERVTMAIVPGTTLEELYSQVKQKVEVSETLEKTIHIFVNGTLIPRVAWSSTVLKHTDVVEYRSVPQKEVGRLILTVAVMYIAYTFGGVPGAMLAESLGLGTAGTEFLILASQAATAMAGTALINAVLPIRPPSQEDPGSTQNQLMVQGGQNQATPYGAIPVVLGKVRMTPPLAMNSFVTFDTVDTKSVSFLNMVLAWGYGPLSIDENTLKIGQTDLSQYDNVTKQTLSYQSTPTNEQINTFNDIAAGDVVQNYSGVELTTGGYRPVVDNNGNPVVVNQAQWNSTYAGGSYYMQKRNPSGEVPTDGTFYTTWTPYQGTVTTYGANGDTTENVTQSQSTVYQFVGSANNWIESTFNQQLDNATVAILFPQGLRKIKVKDGSTATTTVEFEIQYRYKLNISTWDTWVPLPNITVTANEKDGFTHTENYKLDNTKLGVEFKIRRLTDTNSEPNTEDRLSHSSVLHSFTGYYSDPTYKPNQWAPTRPVGLTVAKTALKIRATDQLNGSIQGISAIVQSICKVWTGTNPDVVDTSLWNTLAPTSNPAALFRHILTHPANPQRIEESEVTSKIDLAKLQYWYKYCEEYQIKTTSGNVASKLEYNSVHGQQRSVLEVLRDVCAAGRASPAMKDGKWTVTIDEPQSVVVQHFTPHNSWGFESVKALPKYPNAFKIQYYNEDKNYQQDEIILPSTGYTKDTAELFETITLPGITKEALAEDFGRWHYAQIKLRPEVYTLNTDIEYLVCNRGDRVKVLHDVPMWGLQSGRIKEKIQSDIFDLDEELPIVENKSYTVRFRGVTDTGTNKVLNTEKQLKTTFDVTNYQVSAVGNIVTLTLGNHPIKVGDRLNVQLPAVTVGSQSVNLSLATAVVSGITSTTISYAYPGQPLVYSIGSVVGTVKLKDGYYTRIQTTTTTTTSEVENGDLFMFGELQQETQDLVVISIEPTSGAKNARLTLVDYGVQTAISGVSDGYNIFTDYYNYTSLAYFSNITGTPVLQLDDIGDKKPTILEDRIVSNESVMTKISTDTFVYAIRVPFITDLTLPKTVTHVQGQIDLVGGNETYKLVSTELEKATITFTDVEEAKTYRLRLRYVDITGRVGGWTEWVTHSVVGKATPPPNVTGFSYEAIPGGIIFSWTKPDIVDYKNTIIKNITGTTWANGVRIFEGDTTTWTWSDVATQNYTIAARHRDTADILSNSDATLNINYLALDLAQVKVELDNDTHQIPAQADGTSPVLALSGTAISVYQGGSVLKYDGIGTAPGRWKILSKADTNLVSGSIQSVVNATTGDEYATINDLVSFSNTNDTGEILFTITGKTTTGVSFTVTKSQTFAKVKNAAETVIYRIVSSTKAVYKNSPNNTTPGPFDEIKGGARKHSGNVTTNFGYLGVTPYVGTVPGTESRVYVGGSDGIIFSPSPTDQSTSFVVRLYETNTSTTVLDTDYISVIFKGDIGLSTALVYAYKRSASTVTDNPGAISYSFSTNQITTATLANGWSKTIPAGTDPLYVTVATASSNTGTDNIAANEWSTPVIQTQSGINSATVYLYRRNNSTTTAPTFRTGGTSTYDFALGDITGFDPNWSDAIPDVANGSVLWVVQATAASTSSTDTLLDAEWSTPQVLSIPGANAKTALITADSFIFRRDSNNQNIAGQVVALTAVKQNTTATVTWTTTPTVTLYNASTGGSAVTTGDTVYIRVADFGSNTSVKVTSTCDGITDSCNIVGVRDGSSGITVILDNPTHQLPSASDGTVNSYSGSGTTIRVLEGSTYRTITAVTPTGNNITPGSVSGLNSTTVTVGVHSGISSDTATVSYNITFTKGDGTSTSIVGVQSLAKNKQGIQGTQGPAGTPGSTGSTGPRSATIYFFYNTAQSSAPTAPTSYTYNFTTGVSTVTGTGWSNTLPTNPSLGATTANNKLWAVRVTFQETSYGGTVNADLVGPFVWTSFDGLVTFTNLANKLGSNGSVSATLIDGGAITANTLTVDKISASTSSTTASGITFGLGAGAAVNGIAGAICGKSESPSTSSGATFASASNYGVVAGTATGDAAGGFYNCRTSTYTTFDTSAVVCTDVSSFYGKRITSAGGLNTDVPITDVTLTTSTYAGAFQYKNTSNGNNITSATLATANYSFEGVGNVFVTGTISATGNVIGYSSSDIRYKTSIKSLTNSLDKLSKIRGVGFRWNNEFYKTLGKHEKRLVKRQDIGVIAQEVKQVFPELVHHDDKGMLTVNYQKLVPVLIEAIKELKTRIEVLEGK